MLSKRACLVLGCILVATAAGAEPPPDAWVLAQRFRPYLKFSVDGTQEEHRPCSWRYYFNGSKLKMNGQDSLTTKEIRENPSSVLAISDVRNLASAPDKDRIANANLEARPEIFQGEPWDRVMLGNGLYAHVTQIDARLVNIEYWILYAYNRVHFDRRSYEHRGDVTSIQVVYDRLVDRLVRISFALHGVGIEAYDLTKARVQSTDLVGVDSAGNSVSVRANAYQVLPFGRFMDGGWRYTKSSGVVYLMEDPQTGRFEHPALFIEWGAHEPWPNEHGTFLAIPKHAGDGISFLPELVDLLGPEDDPFRYFGGKLSHPLGLLRHRFWLLEGIPVDDSLRNDRDPYTNLGPLRWPPPRVRPSCTWTGPIFSVGYPVGVCPGGIQGVACEGSNCADLYLECCSQPPVNTVPSTAYWSDPISDEDDGHVCSGGRYVRGVQCEGRECDNLSLFCDGEGTVTGACQWMPFFSEEQHLSECSVSEVIAGVKCRGDYCDDLSLYCCQPSPTPDHGQCTWTDPFSEEEGDGRCDGAMRGIACTGSYCDDLSLDCCTAPPVKTNPGTDYWSPYVSDENDGHVCLDGRFVKAIHCEGRYCDNLSLLCDSQGAVTGACRWTEFYSEEQGLGLCEESEVIAGLKCRGDYCDNLSLYCCQP